MEYVNIITKEPITDIPGVYGFIIIGICITLLFITYGCLIKIVDTHEKITKYLIYFSFALMTVEFIAFCICSAYLSVPTGKYKYTATIDKDKITVSQYEKFIEEYNPTIVDGVYYWEE